jgi:ABC-2 type transport system ATP-binding protein
MSDAIHVSGLGKRYGDVIAVESLSFRVPAGSLFGVIGPNGAGKSTILGCVTGLLECSAGSVRLLGEPVSPDALAIKRRIGVMSEDLGLFDYLYPGEFLGIHAEMFGVSRAVAIDRSRDLLEALALAPHGGKVIGELSAGLRKRLSFAAATITAPEILFLDEPFESVDPSGVALMKDWLCAYTGAGKTVFMTTHLLDAAQRVCDRVLIIAPRARLLWEGDITPFASGKSVHVNGAAVSSLEALFMATSGAGHRPALDWLTGSR